MKKKIFTLLLALLASIGMLSAKIQINGLYYNLNFETQTAEVTYEDRWINYAGITVQTIPSMIEYNGVTYSVTSIGESAFKGCSWWRTFTIPSSITSIGHYAFDGCSSLAYLTISDGVSSIESGAFSRCTSLTSITIPNSVTSIGSGIFSGCTSLSYINVDSNNLSYCSVDGILFSKDKTVLIQYPVGNTTAEYTIPNSVTTIGSSAFSACGNLTSIIIPNSVTIIEYLAFYGCSGLTSVTMGNSVTGIGESAFEGCSSLTSITIPNSVTSIDWSAFSNCSSLTSFDIPNSVTSIGWNAFSGCSGLTSVNIGNSVIEIGGYAFRNCTSLTSITIPNSVTSIESGVFEGCTSLTSIEVDSNNLSYCSVDGILFNKDKTVLIQYPVGNTTAEYTIPNSVTTIGSSAFYSCSGLTSVTIGNSVTSIGESAFEGCSSLTSIYVNTTIPPVLGSSTFNGISSNAIVYVPFGASTAFKSSFYWMIMNIALQSNIQYSANARSTSTVLQFDVEDVEIQSCSIEGGESEAGNILEYIGLEPNSEYKDIPVILTSNTGETETIAVSFSTTALELTTQPSKPVSSTTAILMANTNMSDAEVSCGFEWKRNDAPVDMDGTKVFCPVANGQMVGRLTNLKDDVYYKYRAFYQSAAGNMFYGEWQYIFTGDNAVEFEPIIYTYEATGVTENEATLKGYAIAGAEDFAEQGFEYWAESRVPHTDNTPARMPAALGEHHTVTATGILMHVTLTDLDEGTVYKYRTYAKTGGQTVYGSEMSFTTKGEYTGTEAIGLVDSSSLQGGDRGRLILRNGQIFILRGDKIYTVTGQEIK